MISNIKPHLTVTVSLLLIVITLTAFWHVQNHEFISLDDHVYISDNIHVRNGLTLKDIKWAFTSYHACNWHPVTWISHMLDCEIYGLNPKGHHFNNLLLHMANSLLLFFLLKRMTGDLWQSAFVAAIFTLHPLHVESVAWAAERKDVLSTLFFMLTLFMYLRYVEKPGVWRYLPVFACFGLGLMCKPMIVTLPFVLLLLDYWPLRRLESKAWNVSNKTRTHSPHTMKLPALHLIMEKTPLILLSAASSIITLTVQHNCGAIKSLEMIPFSIRITNALLSYTDYISKLIWPHHLAFPYPHPGTALSLWQVAGSTFLLVAISVLAFRTIHTHAYFIVGWLWYVGTLVPVIGLVQVGTQKMADRYTYVPLIGLFIIIAWGVPRLVSRLRYHGILVALSALICCFSLLILTRLQVQHWRNSMTLFQHSVDVTSNNYLAHYSLGVVYSAQGNLDLAIYHYSEALRIHPESADTYYNLGNVLFRENNLNKAIYNYSQALRINPDCEKTHNNLGIALAAEGKLKEAISHFSEALRIDPDYKEARDNLALALHQEEQADKTKGTIINH